VHAMRRSPEGVAAHRRNGQPVLAAFRWNVSCLSRWLRADGMQASSTSTIYSSGASASLMCRNLHLWPAARCASRPCLPAQRVTKKRLW